jgi:hypothetical protein
MITCRWGIPLMCYDWTRLEVSIRYFCTKQTCTRWKRGYPKLSHWTFVSWLSAIGVSPRWVILTGHRLHSRIRTRCQVSAEGCGSGGWEISCGKS